MSQRKRNPLNIQLNDPTDKEAWRQAQQAVADVLDTDPEDLSRCAVARELAESYVGNDALGKWREDRDA